MQTTVRWDSHVHLFDRGINADTPPGTELRSYQRARQKFGIAAALVVGYEGAPSHIGNNEYIAGLAREHSWIAPLRFVACGSEVDELEEEFVGYSLYLNEWQANAIDIRHLFQRLSDASRTSTRSRPIVSINATPLAVDVHRDAIAVLRDCTVMVSHLGLPGHPASNYAEAQATLLPLLNLAKDFELVVKLSGVYATDADPSGAGAAPYVEVLLESLGPSRLIWGSDFAPVITASSEDDGFNLRPAIADLFTGDEIDSVLGGNLSKSLSAAGFRVNNIDSLSISS